jgi:tetratricopeptide (TPR) repeat protein
MSEQWSDSDFRSYQVRKENAGPDEKDIFNGDVIYQSKNPLFSALDCQALIDEARTAIDVGLRTERNNVIVRDRQPTNSELGEAKVSTLPRAREWLRDQLHSKLFPVLRNRFGVGQFLTLHDALIIGYGYFGGGCQSQPIHRDSSLLSLNVALSPRSDYEGGGTYFEALGQCLHQEQGHFTCHPGGIMHAGHGITSGERWVLVLFVLDESKPQLARRCHLLGLEAQRQSHVEQAKIHFQASLSLVPNNHLVYKDLGRSYMQENRVWKARECLAVTTDLYFLDAEAALGLANLLLEVKRPRAALRRLDKLLTQLSGADLSENAWRPLRALGWEARYRAASCAIQCALQNPQLSSQFLPGAIQRIEVCLESAPNHPILQDMMGQAIGMMHNHLKREEDIKQRSVQCKDSDFSTTAMV